MKQSGKQIAEKIYFSDPEIIANVHKKWLAVSEGISIHDAIHCEKIAINHIEDMPRGMSKINEYLNEIK